MNTVGFFGGKFESVDEHDRLPWMHAPEFEKNCKKFLPENLPESFRYRERRDKNNIAAKRSRMQRKKREQHMLQKVNHLEKENADLKTQIAAYVNQVDMVSLKELSSLLKL